MILKTLLQRHHEYSSELYSLHKNFGDGYLLKNNFIFRQVRKKTIELGYVYSLDCQSQYHILALSQLDALLEKKEIPYLDNVQVLQSIEDKIPGQIDYDHFTDNIKRNHVFHESCHAISRATSHSLRSKCSEHGPRIGLMLLEESFANTCELLGVAEVQDLTHRIFYEMNSYVCVFDDKTNLKNALAQFGPKNFFKFILLSYYHANFLNDQFSENDFKRILNLSFGLQQNFASKQLKILRSMAKNTFALNPRFRQITTSFYLRLNGIPKDAKDAFSFDHIKLIEDNKFFEEYIDQLVQIILG